MKNGVGFECEYNLYDYNDELFNTLQISFPKTLLCAVPKRKAEFLAGRFVVKQAINMLDIEPLEISIGLHRAPQWPNGIVGSISHSGNKAFCFLSQFSSRVGIDYEEFISNKIAEEIKYSIISVEEEQLCSSSEYSFNQILTMIFSAKESLFKALYPSVKRYFDFLDVRVLTISNSVPIEQKKYHGKYSSVTLQLQTDLSSELCDGLSFKLYYQWRENGVLTFIENQ